MKFSEVALFFEEISQHTSRLTITQLLAQLFEKTTPQEAQVLSYLILGTVRPSYLGSQFNLAEKSLIKIIARLLEKTEDAIKKRSGTLGDLGLVIKEGEWRSRSSLSVEEVYEALVHIEDISGIGSQEEKAQKVYELLQSLDPLAAQFIVRIILGRLRLGFSDMTLIDGLSWMLVGNKSLHDRIETAYSACADIGLIAYTLKEKGIKGLDAVEITIGIPLRPAAAERMPTAQAVFDKIGACVAQLKLDGFRLQVHIDNRAGKKHMWFFSRNLIDMSAMFPDLKEALKQLPVKTFIAEGEAIAYDEEIETFAPFQETITRKRKHAIDQAIESTPLKLFFFDVLYLNGHPLLHKTHEERRYVLEEVFKDVYSDKIAVIEEKKIKTVEQLENYFLRTIERGLEGLVLKKPDAHYQPGKRNFNWIKLKRQSEGYLEDTIDAVILGYYFGRGKRASFGIGAFLVGIYDKKRDIFETIARIGTGLSDEDWKALRHRCDKEKSKDQPHNIVCAPELYPDVWVNPEIICTIAADEITLSPLHTAGQTEKHPGFALRFPRFIEYRPDKSARETTTLEEIKKMYKDQTYQSNP